MNKKRKAKKNMELGYYYFGKGETDIGFYFFERGLGNGKSKIFFQEWNYYFLAEKYLERGDTKKAIKFSSLGALIFNTKNRLGIEKGNRKNPKK